MPIRRRFETVGEYEAPEPVFVDSFDPKADPYPGSELDRVGLAKDKARPVACREAYVHGARLPSNMGTQDLLAQLRMSNNPDDELEQRYRDRITSPLTAIRAYCVMCQGGSPKAASMCDKVECPVWPFRLGQNAFYGRK